MPDQRLKRRKNDYERLVGALEGNNFVSIVETEGTPPNRYTIAFNVKGMTYDPSTGETPHATHHEAEIILLEEYPLAPPYCKIKTMTFHPNMSESEIWIGDERTWSASESLLDVVKHLARMISYQEYDLNMPLNKQAAEWAKKNESALPLDDTDFFAQELSEAEPDSEQRHEAETEVYCAYCQQSEPTRVCDGGHAACDDCLSTCDFCENITCMACADNACRSCREKIETHYSAIEAAIDQGNINEGVSLARNAWKSFKGVKRIRKIAEKVGKIKKTIAYIRTCKKSRCFHGIVTACQELKVLGVENEIISNLAIAASKKMKKADDLVAQGKKELQSNHHPEPACQYFSKALEIVPDHPSAYKMLEEATACTDKARKYVGSAKERLEKGDYGRALDDGKQALSLDAGVGPEAEEIVETAGRLLKKQRRKRKKRILILVTTGVLLILGSVVSFYVWEERRLETEYHLFLQTLENEPTMEAKVESLSVYVMSHEASKFTMDAEDRIKDLSAVIQKEEFERAKHDADVMLKNKDYEKAEAIYQQLLSQIRDTVYASEVNKRIAEVHSLADDKDYETLRALPQSNPRIAVGAYRSYLTKHPKGKYREEVSELIVKVSEEYYRYFKEEIVQLQDKKNWGKCVEACNEFDKNLVDSKWKAEVETLRIDCLKRGEGEQDLAVLIVKADAEGEDHASAKQVYLKYLEENPDSPVKTRIMQRVNDLDEHIRRDEIWETLRAYIISEENDLEERISKMREYVAQNPSGEHLEEATRELNTLEERHDTILWKETIEACRDAKTSTKSKIHLLETFVRKNASGKYLSEAEVKLNGFRREEASRRWKEIENYCNNYGRDIADRMNKLTLYMNQNATGEFSQDAQRMLRKLGRFSREEQMIRKQTAQAGNVYAYQNGTITDRRTGLMWCAFDSYLDLQQSLTYDSAAGYVARINFGGYTDWRLPSEEALRTIYKSKPFFPTASDGKWYWTANHGGGRMVPVVTTEKETTWQMMMIESDVGRGSVRAVRGP